MSTQTIKYIPVVPQETSRLLTYNDIQELEDTKQQMLKTEKCGSIACGIIGGFLFQTAVISGPFGWVMGSICALSTIGCCFLMYQTKVEYDSKILKVQRQYSKHIEV